MNADNICRGRYLSDILCFSGALRTVGREDSYGIHDHQVWFAKGIDIGDALVEVDLVKLLHVPDDPDKILHPEGELCGKVMLGDGKIDEDLRFKDISEDLGLFQFSPFGNLYRLIDILTVAREDIGPCS